jgi:chitosanase
MSDSNDISPTRSKQRGPLRHLSAVVLATVVIAGATAGYSSRSSSTTTTKPPKTKWMTSDQRYRADQLVSVFEDGTTTIRYSNAENLNDGRGITAGRAGFTTATCDLAEVVTEYTSKVKKNVFEPFVDELTALCNDHSDDTEGLGEEVFIAAWKTAAKDVRFRRAQDAVLDRLYFKPAMIKADDAGLSSVLGRATFYDTAIQHGLGDDPDGLDALIERTNKRAGNLTNTDESEWLDMFFTVRIEDLKNPDDSATASAWSQSVDRVSCFRSIAETKNLSLKGPVTCNVFGTEYTVK